MNSEKLRLGLAVLRELEPDEVKRREIVMELCGHLNNEWASATPTKVRGFLARKGWDPQFLSDFTCTQIADFINAI